MGQRLVFSRLRADLGTEAVTSLLQLPMYVLDNKMDRDSVAQRRMKICLQIEVDCQRSAVSYTPDQKKKCSLCCFIHQQKRLFLEITFLSWISATSFARCSEQYSTANSFSIVSFWVSFFFSFSQCSYKTKKINS